MDGIQFEPNLFRDSQQVDDVVSSSQTRVSGGQQSSHKLLSENAKIFALLLAGSKSRDREMLKLDSIREEQPHQPTPKVSFQQLPLTSDSASDQNFDPFQPDLYEVHNPHLSNMLSSLYKSVHPCLPVAPSTPNAHRHRPRRIDAADTRHDSRHSNTHNITQQKVAPSSCSTPLSRFIELCEHDDESGSQAGDESDEEGFMGYHSCFASASPATPALLQLPRPPSAGEEVAEDGQCTSRPRRFFTFADTHTAEAEDSSMVSSLMRPAATGAEHRSKRQRQSQTSIADECVDVAPALSSTTESMGHLSGESHLDSLLQFFPFPLTPLVAAPRLLLEDSDSALSAAVPAADNNEEAPVPGRVVLGLHGESGGESAINSPAQSRHLEVVPARQALQHTKLAAVLSPESRLEAVDGAGLPVPSDSCVLHALPPLPPPCVAPPATLEALLRPPPAVATRHSCKSESTRHVGQSGGREQSNLKLFQPRETVACDEDLEEANTDGGECSQNAEC